MVAALLIGGCVPEGSGIRTKDASEDGSTSGSEDTSGSTSGSEDTSGSTSGSEDTSGSTSGSEDTNIADTDEPDTNEPDTDEPDTTTCTPVCEQLGLECGSDPICGTSCGTCDAAFICANGTCVPDNCVPECSGIECGPDPVCGTECGVCDTSEVCTFGTCEPSACVPDCSFLECGPDPVCGESCGDCLSTESCTTGQCIPNASGSPSVTALSVNPTTITPTASGSFSATVTDPDGLSDIAGGTLRDPSGNTYGTFSGSGGSYSVSLTWNQINAVSTIDAPPGGVTRVFEAAFLDMAGNQGTRQVTATLSCGANSATCTPGTCSSLTSLTQCGACTNDCNSGNVSQTDVVATASGCVAEATSAYCTYDMGQLARESCATACQNLGMTCNSAEAHYASYLIGACLSPCNPGCPAGQTCGEFPASSGQMMCIPDSQQVTGLQACSLDADCSGGAGVCATFTTDPFFYVELTGGCSQTPAASVPPDASIGLSGGDWDYQQMYCKCRRP